MSGLLLQIQMIRAGPFTELAYTMQFVLFYLAYLDVLFWEYLLEFLAYLEIGCYQG